MQSVNNGLIMSSNSNAMETALDKIKNILISFEKKKRNLEKRKNKLDEYKKKEDLNEDQQCAVAKYPEVMSNLELLEELTTHAVQQLREAEKTVKKIKKQEKADKRRSDLQLIELVLRNYSALERIGSNEQIRRRLVCDGITSDAHVASILDFFDNMRISDKGDWKPYSEQLQGYFESTSSTEEKRGSRDELIASIDRLANLEWLWVDEVERCASSTVPQDAHSQTSVIEEELIEENIVIIDEHPPATPKVNIVDNAKMSFVFLHDSVVQDDPSKIANENGHARFAGESEARPSSQASEGNSSHTWQTSDAAPIPKVEDVFSSATQSEFMNTEGIRANAWTKNARTPLNGRFRTRGNAVAAFASREDQVGDASYFKASRGSFNSDPRFPRATRVRGRGRGNGRPDNRMSGDALTSQ